ncbi:hypothetical protein VPH35_048175 [Triticum aestivum]
MAASPHLLVFLVVALAASGSNGAVAAAGDHDDVQVQLRKVDLSQAIEVLSRYRPETTDAETLKRAVAVVNREAQRYWKPIFNNVNKALLNRELGQGPDAIKMDFEYV